MFGPTTNTADLDRLRQNAVLLPSPNRAGINIEQSRESSGTDDLQRTGSRDLGVRNLAGACTGLGFILIHRDLPQLRTEEVSRNEKAAPALDLRCKRPETDSYSCSPRRVVC